MGTDSSRGFDDNQCPQNWPVIKVQQDIAGPYLFTTSDTKLVGINTTNTQYCRLSFREYYSSNLIVVVPAERLSQDTFNIEFESGHLSRPGLYIGSFTIYESDGHTSSNVDNQSIDGVPDSTATLDSVSVRPIWTKRVFVEIEPNNINNNCGGLYPLSIAELRLALRDECPLQNYLLDDVEYTDKEIFFSINRVVDKWNETPPDVIKFSYANFPFRYHWTQAVMGMLLRGAARHKLRNWLPYQGGGVNVNDASIWSQYDQLGKDYLNEFNEWMMRKKVEININGGFNSLPGAVVY